MAVVKKMFPDAPNSARQLLIASLMEDDQKRAEKAIKAYEKKFAKPK